MLQRLGQTTYAIIALVIVVITLFLIRSCNPAETVTAPGPAAAVAEATVAADATADVAAGTADVAPLRRLPLTTPHRRRQQRQQVRRWQAQPKPCPSRKL
ncbi:MAG: hypothetical protein R2867_33265 [Caldilineaceae bacterium]